MKRLIPSLIENYPSPLGELTLAADAEGLIGEGEHVRYIVDRARFLAKLGL